MAKKSPNVDAFLAENDHPMLEAIQELRGIIKGASSDFTEHIKWNAPSFCINGDDRITFNFPPKKNSILLVFHCGAKVKTVPPERLIKDEHGLLDWKTNDRAVAKFTSLEEIEKLKPVIVKTVTAWIVAAQ